jgi:hypothetical protein
MKKMTRALMTSAALALAVWRRDAGRRPGMVAGEGRRALQGDRDQRYLPGSSRIPGHHKAAARVRAEDRHQGQLRDPALRELARAAGA